MNPQESELVLNEDGSVYHLKLKPEHIADNVILVGDPERVKIISGHFEEIEYQVSNREFVTHTGIYKGTRVTALATGIGTDNIDIVVNELDAAVNFDLKTRQKKKNLKTLNLIRIGTCGALQAAIAVDTVVVSKYSIGLDGVKHFYDIEENEPEKHIRQAFESFNKSDKTVNPPYVGSADAELFSKLQHLGTHGITLTANGFFGPQGRSLRLPLAFPHFNASIDRFQVNEMRILNYEMESSALFALGGALGHKCACLCLVVANRAAKQFSKDYHSAMNDLIIGVLDSLNE
ncbi:MAG: nucleoside phosphorylase [Salibacteraceae bacterium]